LRAEDAVTEAEYEAVAVPELKELVRALDELDLPGFEAELASDILTLEFTDGARFIVNSHRAARQIWMAAELKAWHFDWLAERQAWVAVKSGEELWATLEGVLSRRLKKSVSLARR
jgi:iron-sulfur cluster assembly protein CyaY